MINSKKINRKAFLVAVLIAVLTAVIFGANNFAPANAGTSKKTVASDDSFKEEIDVGFWEVLGNVGHEYNSQTGKGAIVFDERGSKSSQIISTVRANDFRSMGLENCLIGEVTLKISSLGGEFYVVFGLEQAFKSMRSGECSAIAFYDDNGSVAVKIINVNRNEDTVTKTSLERFSYGANLSLEFNALADGRFILSINGKTIASEDTSLPFKAEGYFGFAQSAANNVKITKASVYTEAYDAPINAEVDEDFDREDFDASRIFVNNNDSAQGYYSPEGVYHEDGVLKFKNITSYGFVSTCYEFSNFEMTFDMPHLQREFEYGEDGKVITPASDFFGFAIGAEQMNNSHIAITESVFLYFRNAQFVDGKPTKLSCVLLNKFSVVEDCVLTGDNDFWNLDNAYDYYGKEKTINFKVRMIDGVFSCSFKWGGENESKYREIIRHDFGFTPFGFVQIHGQGNGAQSIVKNDSLTCANFWIDNLKVSNKDAVPSRVEPTYVTSRIEMGRDYDYVDTWDYRTKTISTVKDRSSQSSGCAANVNASGIYLGVSALAVCATIIVLRRKRDEK